MGLFSNLKDAFTTVSEGARDARSTLTAEKVCGVCGKRIGTVDAIYRSPELQDNCYLCHDCKTACSPNLSLGILSSWNENDVREHMAYVRAMPELMSSFRETACVQGPQPDSGKILLADDNAGLWTPAASPELFAFNQVESWSLSIHTSSVEGTGVHWKTKPPRPGMPVPGRTEELTSMTLVVRLANHPYADEVSVSISGANTSLFKRYRTYTEDCYACALRCYQLFEARCPQVMGEIQFFDL